MNLKCPKCGSEISLDDVNVAQDLALCRSCKETYSFASLKLQSTALAVDPLQPPHGAWYRSQANEFEAGATVRSGTAFFLVPFTLIWSGGSLGGIYGTQIIHHHFVWSQSLFGIPFLLFSFVLIPITLMTLLGKVIVRGAGDQGLVFIGVGPIGWKRSFQWNDIKSAQLSLSKWQQNGRYMPLIELAGPNPIRFGSGLSDQRRNFILAILQRYVRRQF